MNVLLVDDDLPVLEGLKAMLQWERLGIQIVGMAQDGEEALAMARANHPDAVITDICMPGMDGLALVEALRRESFDAEIFLLSGHDEFEYARRAMQFGVKHYLLKPVTRQTIAQLQDELCIINERLKAKKTQREMLASAEYEDMLRKALWHGNTEHLEDAFSALHKQQQLANENIVGLCIWLLDILYGHLERIIPDEQAVKRSRTHAIDEMLALKKREDKLFFVEQQFFSVAQSRQDNKGSQPRIAKRARQIIDARFAQSDFSISSLADEMGLTASYVSTVFRQSEGVSMSMYLTDLRLAQARKLLAESDAPISEIARISGYIDGHYFAKIFKKKYHITPTEFRNAGARRETRE